MRFAEQISEDVWKFKADSNAYLVNKEVMIDTGSRANREELKSYLSKIVDLNEIKAVIFTHLHADHIGNFDLFPNAKYYASKNEIESLKQDPEGTVLDLDIVNKFKVELHSLEDNPLMFRIIKTPGHTKGSICILYKDILFSGDTLLKEGPGRTDLPSSAPSELQKSLNKLVNVSFKVLCTGHEY